MKLMLAERGPGFRGTSHAAGSRALLAAGGLALSAGGLTAVWPVGAVVLLVGVGVVTVLPRIPLKWLLTGTMVILYYVPTLTGPGSLLESYPAVSRIGLGVVPAVVFALFLRARRDCRRFAATGVGLALLLVVCAAVLAAVVARTSILNLSLWMLAYLRYPLLFLALVNARPSSSDFMFVIRSFVFLTVLQVPEVLARFFIGGYRGDQLTYSLGSYGTFPLGVYCIYSLALVLAAMRFKRLPAATVLLAALLLVPAPLGEIKALLLLGPVVAVVVLTVPTRMTVGRTRRVLAVAGILVVGSVLYTSWSSVWFSGRNSLNIYVDQVMSMIMPGHSAGAGARESRVVAARRSVAALRSVGGIGLGTGPGSSFVSEATGSVGSLVAYGGKMAGYVQPVGIMWDGGLVLLAGFVAMLGCCLAYIVKALRSPKETIAWIGCAAMGMWVFYAALGPLYERVWRRDAPGFLFWLVMAYLYLLLENERTRAGRSTACEPNRSGAVG